MPQAMPLLLRAAQIEDIDDIFAVRTSVRENALTLEELAELGITHASVAQMLAQAPCAWVACEASTIVAFAMIDEQAGSLFAAFVLPSHEGRGIGRALVARAEQALFARHPVAWLETARESRAAGFYRRLGWGDERDVGGGDIRLQKRRA
ncbi:GNAT family N-acetyltransferase [Luteimonas sp. TWI1416]|uniref:GNAT family N-acetyltransferase n=1 Tax=unclassified Luteimonas TaxID=2629088 RepID=UPI00320AC9DA